MIEQLKKLYQRVEYYFSLPWGIVKKKSPPPSKNWWLEFFVFLIPGLIIFLIVSLAQIILIPLKAIDQSINLILHLVFSKHSDRTLDNKSAEGLKSRLIISLDNQKYPLLFLSLQCLYGAILAVLILNAILGWFVIPTVWVLFTFSALGLLLLPSLIIALSTVFVLVIGVPALLAGVIKTLFQLDTYTKIIDFFISFPTLFNKKVEQPAIEIEEIELKEDQETEDNKIPYSERFIQSIIKLAYLLGKGLVFLIASSFILAGLIVFFFLKILHAWVCLTIIYAKNANQRLFQREEKEEEELQEDMPQQNRYLQLSNYDSRWFHLVKLLAFILMLAYYSLLASIIFIIRVVVTCLNCLACLAKQAISNQADGIITEEQLPYAIKKSSNPQWFTAIFFIADALGEQVGGILSIPLIVIALPIIVTIALPIVSLMGLSKILKPGLILIGQQISYYCNNIVALKFGSKKNNAPRPSWLVKGIAGFISLIFALIVSGVAVPIVLFSYMFAQGVRVLTSRANEKDQHWKTAIDKTRRIKQPDNLLEAIAFLVYYLFWALSWILFSIGALAAWAVNQLLSFFLIPFKGIKDLFSSQSNADKLTLFFITLATWFENKNDLPYTALGGLLGYIATIILFFALSAILIPIFYVLKILFKGILYHWLKITINLCRTYYYQQIAKGDHTATLNALKEDRENYPSAILILATVFPPLALTLMILISMVFWHIKLFFFFLGHDTQPNLSFKKEDRFDQHLIKGIGFIFALPLSLSFFFIVQVIYFIVTFFNHLETALTWRVKTFNEGYFKELILQIKENFKFNSVKNFLQTGGVGRFLALLILGGVGLASGCIVSIVAYVIVGLYQLILGISYCLLLPFTVCMKKNAKNDSDQQLIIFNNNNNERLNLPASNVAEQLQNDGNTPIEDENNNVQIKTLQLAE